MIVNTRYINTGQWVAKWQSWLTTVGTSLDTTAIPPGQSQIGLHYSDSLEQL